MRRDLPKTGWTRDIDLGERIADDIEPDQQESARRENRRQRLPNPTVLRTQGSRHTGAPRRQIAPSFSGRRDAGQAKRNDFTTDQKHPFIAFGNLRQKALRHDGASAKAMHGLENDRQIGIVGPCPENRGAAHPIEQFEDSLAVLDDKSAQPRRIPRHQRGRSELRKLQNRELLVMVPQRPRVVEHPRALRLRPLQELGCIQILEVKRRVLAHHDRIKPRQRDQRRRAAFKPGNRGASPPRPAVVARSVIGSGHGRRVIA